MMQVKRIYRLFLILLLIAAIGGGIWYCFGSYESDRVPEDGTLVKAETEFHNGYLTGTPDRYGFKE